MELVAGTRTEHTHWLENTLVHTWMELNWLLRQAHAIFFHFHKPVSFAEVDLRLPALLGRGVFNICYGRVWKHQVPVNFNHIKLSWSLTEGMLPLYMTLHPLLSLSGDFFYLWEFYENKGCLQTLAWCKTGDIHRRVIQTESSLTALWFIAKQKLSERAFMWDLGSSLVVISWVMFNKFLFLWCSPILKPNATKPHQPA